MDEYKLLFAESSAETIDEHEKFMDHNKKEYFGIIQRWSKSKNKKYISPLIKKANYTYTNILKRVSGKDHPNYKGIGIGFTKREFVYWWIVQNRFFKLNKPSIGRVNHSRGYFFDNIKLEEHSENSREARKRCGTFVPGKPILIKKNGKIVAEACSANEAGLVLGFKSVGKVAACANGKKKQVNGWSFEWK